MTAYKQITKSKRITQSKVKFIQIISTQYEGTNGIQSRVVALGNDGVVYQYVHAERAWIPMSTTIIQSID